MRGWSEGYNASPTEGNKARLEEAIGELTEMEEGLLQSIRHMKIETKRLEEENTEKADVSSMDAVACTSTAPS